MAGGRTRSPVSIHAGEQCSHMRKHNRGLADSSGDQDAAAEPADGGTVKASACALTNRSWLPWVLL